jgi:hypothetical protein
LTNWASCAVSVTCENKSRRFCLLSRETGFYGVLVGADSDCILASGIGVDGSAGRDGGAS